MCQKVPMAFLLPLVYLGAVAYISAEISLGLCWRRDILRVKGQQFFNFVPFSRLINFVRQRRKTAKNVGSGTQTIALTKQTEKSLGPVGSVFLIIFWTFS